MALSGQLTGDSGRYTMPEVAAEIDDEDRSLLNLEIAALARATCQAIENGEESSMCRHFEFIDTAFSKATLDVKNAVYVSCLENVFLGEQTPQALRARSALPSRLSAALSDLEAHWKLLNAASKGT